MIRRPRLAVALCCAATMVAGCTGRDLDPPTSSPTASSGGSVASSSQASGSESSASLTPVTDPGLVTGPGVDDASVSLGLLVDDDRDQGFTAGVRLWARAFNRSGGVCGRTVQLLSPAVDERGADAYRSLADSSFGLITLPPADFRTELATMVAADRLPTDTPEGTISDLTTVGGPVVLGATDDVLAINTAAHWVTDGTLQPGSRLAVLTGTADADGADRTSWSALQWWSTGSGVEVVSTTPDDPLPDDVSAMYAIGDATELRTLVQRLAGERGLAPVARTGLPTTTPSPSTSGASSALSPPATTATDSSAPPSTSVAPSSQTGTDDPVAVGTDLDGARA
ncbi:MAG: ABC transporter substrate-binding protein, partial [Williamsia herbipolensis]|nr:ABC transporter substrate-binding protein [Williamsia herbipolensis]